MDYHFKANDIVSLIEFDGLLGVRVTDEKGNFLNFEIDSDPSARMLIIKVQLPKRGNK